ncbi:hypothetical protein ElyMa_000231000 [Elysia marginata]|uniref:Ion transport domain-containing protein n=1 Tax=Elysia marginata TaxID=1093978 RepID=A0AAV4F0D7_9GAST|nr:hypothetical protein ElyMa_000231000 [Elysia marginata]
MTKYIGVPKRRKGAGDDRPLQCYASPERLKSWAQEVLQVLDKPNVAVCIFIFGVIIIVVASKQLKFTFDIIEYYWGGGRPQDGFMGNFMVILVFMFVWLDTIILQWAKGLVLEFYAFANRKYNQVLEALEKIQEDDEIEALQQRKMLRKKRAASTKT